MRFCIITFFLICCSLSLHARVDVDVIVYYTYNENSYGAFYERKTSEPVVARITFISGSEFNIPKPSNEKYAIVWFSQTECAVIKLKPPRFNLSSTLRWDDLPDLTGGSSSVSGEKINGEELDDLGMPFNWHFEFRDKKNGNAYVDRRLEERFYSYYPLFV